MDQDDSMLSTPSSHPEDLEDETFAHDDDEDDESLFPTSTQHTAPVPAQIPQNDHLNAAAPGELSPPRSQSIDAGDGLNGFGGQQPRSMDDGMGDDDEDDEGVDMAGSGLLPSKATGGGRDAEGQDVASTYKPGASWKNKKAQDEMQRSWDQCVDRDFSLKEYGDVMAGRIQVGD